MQDAQSTRLIPAEEFVSNFRTNYAAVLTVAALVLTADGAHAQAVTASAPSRSSGYLAGLPPPHEAHNAAHPGTRRAKTTGVHQVTTLRAATSKTVSKKDRPTTTAIATPHVPNAPPALI